MDRTVRNYFVEGVDARRYARARPNIHPRAIDRFGRLAGTSAPFRRALDVGCGTGHSTVALTEIADSVTGMDASREMLTHIAIHPKACYVQAAAEAVPFRNAAFDLVVAAQAFHWFDADAFLTESSRLVDSMGWLLIYNGWFDGRIVELSTFSEWEAAFLRRYPSPPRHRTPITEQFAQQYGLALRGTDQFWQEVPMSIETFIEFQLSTTNVLRAVQQGDATFDDAATWMRDSLKPFFIDSAERTFVFGAMMWCLQKSS